MEITYSVPTINGLGQIEDRFQFFPFSNLKGTFLRDSAFSTIKHQNLSKGLFSVLVREK